MPQASALPEKRGGELQQPEVVSTDEDDETRQQVSRWTTKRKMYPRTVIPRMVELVRAGLIDLAQFEVTTFPLERANDAVARAASHSSPFELTALSA